ncbi:hypothetical protein [Flagellimonas sp.]|uniref:hypothetical protein n=1 Tax=Flagellimonas sp. TaxID=2058762 RepID=UPI003B50A8C6
MKEWESLMFKLIIGIFTISLVSCGGGDGGGEEPPKEQKNPPAKAVGTLPTNGEPCSDYEEVSSDDSKVLVAFKWNAAQLAQNYVLRIVEGSTEVFRNSFSALETKVQLDRGKTYSWSLTSVNNDGETGGDTYSFTTPGIPQGNFAPYAADIAIEFNTQNSEVSISWVGSDEDGDQLTYDVTIWENDLLIVEEIDYDQITITPIAYKNGENYTVEVISKDTSGNFSISVATDRAPK